MTHIRIFTGNASSGIAIAAAAGAAHAAQQGTRTLLLSFAPPHSLGALLGAEVTNIPAQIASNLDAVATDGPADLAAAWERGRAQMPAALAGIAGDELPLLPGIELLFGLLRLVELAPKYAAVFVDAGPHEALLRALALPDGLRWATRLLFGLDRGPGRNPASVARAALPTSFLPLDVVNGVQDVRVQVEKQREQLANAVAYFVLRPDRVALAEARFAIPAFHLHGLAVPVILAGPVQSESDAQAVLLNEAAELWPDRPFTRFTFAAHEADLDALAALGTTLPIDNTSLPTPISYIWNGEPALAVALPALPKGALHLTLSGDEMIVRVGPYRRHLLLPESLRGTSAIRATREGEHLVVRRRTV